MTIRFPRPMLVAGIVLFLAAAERLVNIGLLPAGTDATSRTLFAVGFGALGAVCFTVACVTRPRKR